MLGLMILYLIVTGVGVWGNNKPGRLGLPDRQLRVLGRHRPRGHADLAILFLFRQKWRTAINRFAEAMTIFAVICAGTSRASTSAASGSAYWLFPIPNQMDMWPQFRSPLLWDVFAVGTYAPCRCSSGTSA